MGIQGSNQILYRSIGLEFQDMVAVIEERCRVAKDVVAKELWSVKQKVTRLVQVLVVAWDLLSAPSLVTMLEMP
jgi:hypothetical protein